MAEGMIATWTDQACIDCGSTAFRPLVKIMAKPGGGVTTTPAGYQCGECGKKADVAAMQRDATRKQRLKELRALEAEIEEGHAAPVPAGVIKP